jgi:hypothetical protein
MKQLFSVLLFVCCCLHPVAAQSPDSSDSQAFPCAAADFFLPTEVRINRQLKENPDANTAFVMRSNFLLDRLLWGGQVEPDDSLSQLARLVAARLLRNDEQTRCAISIYTLNSSDVNAWTFDRGVILITTGLYARLENEAQLAFVLAHEISHYKSKHALNTFALQSCDDLQRCSAPERLNRINSYSRENEMQADRDGIAMMQAAGYDLSTVTSVFDLLQYSYLPVHEIKFRKNYFEDESLVFPGQYFLGIVNEIVRRDVVNDTTGTHPTIRKRRVVADFIRDSVPAAMPRFIASNEIQFLHFCKLANKALGKQLICEAHYREALYHAYTMQELWPDVKPEAELLIAQSLYGIALLRATLHKGDDEISNFTRYAGVQGELQQVYYLFSKLGAMESAVLALHYNWKCSTKYPENTLYVAQRERLLKLVTGFYRLDQKDFSENGPPAEQEQKDAGNDVRGEVYATKPSYDFHTYALAGLLKTDFREAFTERVSFYSSHSFIDEITAHDHPLKRIVLFDPFIKITDRKNPGNQFFYEEEKKRLELERKFDSQMEADNVTKVSCASVFYRYPDQQMTERTLLSQYVNERLLTGPLFFPAPAGLAALEQLRLNGPAEFKSTRYILLAGITSQQHFKTTDLQSIDPVAGSISGKPRTAYFALLLDAQNGRMLLNEYRLSKKPLTEKQINAWVETLRVKIRQL